MFSKTPFDVRSYSCVEGLIATFEDVNVVGHKLLY
jgi:hypothetical protein